MSLQDNIAAMRILNLWPLYALLSAVAASLVAIFAKLGLKDIDPILATTLRSLIMATFLVGVTALSGKFENFTLADYNPRQWGLMILAGIAGAVSWLFYFLALREGDASAVAAIDRLSLVFVVILAALFLGERLSVQVAIGAVLMSFGAILISLKPSDLTRLWIIFNRLL
jgi:bacterial/archaeal transporter family protein